MRRRQLTAVSVLAALLLMSLDARSDALAHGTEAHEAGTQQAAVRSDDAKLDDTLRAAFPVEIGGSFELVDHLGRTRASGGFDGAYQLIFFGYARCESICPVALRTMLEAADRLTAAGHEVQPLLITVDPEGEPPAVLKTAVEAIHPRLLGLTGTKDEIAAVEKAFHVKSELVGTNIKGDKVFAHGSYVYLMAPDGHFLTLLPPILDAATMAEKFQAYM
ncbi:MAG TPA: SCO family protein [Kiloniellaceae bacterium]|nr:SCO family protein [Kiloniellaceae bacterium]